MTKAHRFAAVIDSDRSFRAENLPFDPGHRVEVIILETREEQLPGVDPEAWRKLKGTVLRYDDPAEPVAVDDWDALK